MHQPRLWQSIVEPEWRNGSPSCLTQDGGEAQGSGLRTQEGLVSTAQAGVYCKDKVPLPLPLQLPLPLVPTTPTTP